MSDTSEAATKREPPDFESATLARDIEALPPDIVDQLPFGAIRLNAEGRVTSYSAAERRLSGYRMETVGRHFFSEIAPCMDHAGFRGRIEQALARGTLDIAFDYVGDFADPDRLLRVRIQSATGGGCWIFMQREDE